MTLPQVEAFSLATLHQSNPDPCWHVLYPPPYIFPIAPFSFFFFPVSFIISLFLHGLMAASTLPLCTLVLCSPSPSSLDSLHPASCGQCQRHCWPSGPSAVNSASTISSSQSSVRSLSSSRCSFLHCVWETTPRRIERQRERE